MNLAHEISAIETELESLRAESATQRQLLGVLEFENEQLRQANARITAERDIYLRRSETIKSLLNQTSTLLVNSMRKFQDSERELYVTSGKETPRLEQINGRDR